MARWSVATLSKGYDLEYIWKQVDRRPAKDAASRTTCCSASARPPTYGGSGSRPRMPSPVRPASPPDSPERITAGLACTLSEAADDGHCYLPATDLITGAAKILDVSAGLIARAWTSSPPPTGWSANSCPRRPGPPRRRPHRRSPPSTSRPSITPNGPWPTPSCACTPPGPTAWPSSPPSTGTRPSAGCAAALAAQGQD